MTSIKGNKNSSNNVTTVKLLKETKTRLDKLKIHNNESYDDVVQEILHVLNLCKREPYEARYRLQEIDEMRAKLNYNSSKEKK
jgi:hypothetical protein